MNTEFNGKQYTMNQNDDGTITLVPVKEEKKGLWKPEIGQEYWSLWGNGHADREIWRNEPFFHGYHKRGSVFPTQEISGKASALQARANKFIAAALQADPEAGEFTDDRRWSVVSNSDGLRAELFFYLHGFPAYVHTREQAEEMKAILEAEGWK